MTLTLFVTDTPSRLLFHLLHSLDDRWKWARKRARVATIDERFDELRRTNSVVLFCWEVSIPGGGCLSMAVVLPWPSPTVWCLSVSATNNGSSGSFCV